jgi:hypothetical protein
MNLKPSVTKTTAVCQPSNVNVLQRVKEDRSVLHTTKRRKANWIGHILRRNCLVKHVIEGMGRRGRRRKQLLGGFKEERGYWKLKDEALDRSVW